MELHPGRGGVQLEIEGGGLERQTLTNTRGMDGSGLWIAQVKHEGNKNSSDEEVAVVAELIDRLLEAGASWTEA